MKKNKELNKKAVTVSKSNSDLAVKYFRKNSEDFLEELKSLVRIKSISAPGFDHKEVSSCAAAIMHQLKEIGMKSVEILDVPGAHPYVFAEWKEKKNTPTVILYSHYDVQPTGDLKKWKTDPFEPTSVGERLFGRGSADDKAGIVANIAALASYLKPCGELPVNVKVIFEGEEEIGSENLPKLLEMYKDKLAADYIIITDTENYDVGIPAITTQLRGLVAVDITVSTLKQPVHSGAWGGPIPDAVQALAKIIAKMTDDDGKIKIPGIYKDVAEISAETRKALKSLPFNEGAFRKNSCLLDEAVLTGEKDFSPHEQIWFRPSLSVNAIQASSREQVSNILVDFAWAHVGIRLVPNLDPKKTLDQLKKFVIENAPKNVLVDVKPHVAVSWWKTDTKHKAFKAAQMALEKGYGRKPVFIGCGGSIGFVDPFSRILGGVPAILLGVEDPNTNAHSWNESLYVPDWKKCVESLIYLYEKLGE
ncbi:MAG: M20/M25/M40 family metallo-hydrolase [Candidatus Paceibacterota bacterium]|jgi:acetylornithine deacetylase/succinyl-diaminopimelate desuccinylase-like protein